MKKFSQSVQSSLDVLILASRFAVPMVYFLVQEALINLKGSEEVSVSKKISR